MHDMHAVEFQDEKVAGWSRISVRMLCSQETSRCCCFDQHWAQMIRQSMEDVNRSCQVYLAYDTSRAGLSGTQTDSRALYSEITQRSVSLPAQ